MVKMLKNLEYLLKPRNLTFIASIGLASLPNMSFGNVQERVQKGLSALAESGKTGLSVSRKSELYAEADNEFREVLKEDECNCDALTGYGWIKLKSGKPEIAVANLEKAASECGSESALEGLISAYIAVKDFDSARKTADVLLQRNSRSANAHDQLGYMHCINKEFREAIDEYEKTVAIDPRMYWIYTDMVAAYAELGDLGNALKNALKSVEVNPYYAPGHYEAGLIYRKVGKIKEAVKELGKAVELAPLADDDNFKEELKVTKAMLKKK